MPSSRGFGDQVRRWVDPAHRRTEEGLERLVEALDEADAEHPRSPDELAESFGVELGRVLGLRDLQIYRRRAVRFRRVFSLRSESAPPGAEVQPPELLPLGLSIAPAVAAADGLLDAERSRALLDPAASAWLEGQRAEHVALLAAEAVDSGTVDSGAMDSGTVDSATVDSATVDPGRETLGLVLLGRRRNGEPPPPSLLPLCRRLAQRLDEAQRRETESMARFRGGTLGVEECPRCRRCFDAGTLYCPDDDAELAPTLPLARVFADRYCLEQRLGRGGMGRVYRAVDRATGSPVAIKIRSLDDATSRGRFAQEAEVVASLDHAGVARCLGRGTLERSSLESPVEFIVMELVPGETLRQRIESEGPLEPSRVADWLEPILGGLAHAHSRSVLHRDLKPENVMIFEDADGREHAKILDFGLSRRLDADTSMTGVGMVLGTLAYMSPEQLASSRLDERTDQYSLSVLVAEALGGRLPFPGRTMGELLRALSQDSFRMDITCLEQARVVDILARGVARDREARWPDVATLGAELLPALRECPRFSRGG